ncbi:ribonuclease P protein component [Corynebacterium sp. CCM 9185]|uniref:Ribonuclease P protein component n=1 Tax=Corynebacterium marambiense TaxID=2765364 RepID=A0ABS0VSS6_9CORY|nr:ribonuclease P protein component [Corynebacterium marambiense]MBI8999814.1 ribonuclease P protein component [Corynebacterium marambiense]MCK7662653.1 ribonuclease P protein component [Corynebacterium marambiense]MCX7543664.1 ribonuclease P protein component [Corynebacterium marambiense]
MLPKEHRLSTPSDFSRTIRGGRRASSRTVVVHLRHTQAEPGEARCGGPRFGLIVSKAVGNAVVRHRTSRRLRHVCGALAQELGDDCDIVIRALPRAGDASWNELERDVRKTLRKLRGSNRE